jgi:hypothetical protein
MRAKLLFVMAVALFWSASVFSQSFRMDSFERGNDLFQVCSDGRDVFQSYCKGYAVGVADALVAVNAMKANGYPIPSACIPAEEHAHVKSEQVRDVVMQWLIAHPERRHQAAAGDALLALQAAFPCK